MSNPDHAATRVRIRRAPKFSVFVIVGGVIGVIVALILTVTFPVDQSVGFGPTFGYCAIYCVTGGVLVAAVIAIILDRAFGRRAKTLSASVDRLQPVDDDAE